MRNELKPVEIFFPQTVCVCVYYYLLFVQAHLKTVFVNGRAGVRYAQKRVQRPAGNRGAVHTAGQFAGFDANSRRPDDDVLRTTAARTERRAQCCARDDEPVRGHGVVPRPCNHHSRTNARVWSGKKKRKDIREVYVENGQKSAQNSSPQSMV